MPEISLVIPTFNSKDFIGPSLNSIFGQDHLEFEVVVVDNGSRDGTVDLIKKSYPQVVLIENEKNLGASKARNQGIEASCGKWVLTLDCDVILEKDFFIKISKIINTLAPEIGVLQPKILKSNKKIIYSCGIHLSWLRRFFDIGSSQEDNGQFNESKYVFGACSACALYNRKMLQDLKEDTGYFDERFFFLVEDVDLAWRAQRSGYRSLFFAQATCYHTGASSRVPRKIRQSLCFRNRYLMIKKNEALLGKLKLSLLGFWYEVPRFLYLLFTNRYTLKTSKEIM